MIVRCNNDNNAEREYILRILLEKFLGLSFTIVYESNIDNYIIENNNAKIVFEDHFFKHFFKPLSYLAINNVPKKVSYLKNDFADEIPIIYGRNYLELQENTIYCGLDIFASSFFMLSRWEEFANTTDPDGLRCNENELFTIKNNLYKQPIVNEYLILLEKLFIKIDIALPKRSRTFDVLLTHDVDRCYLSSFKELVVNLKIIFILQKNYLKASQILTRYIFYKIFNINPFNSFKELMDYSDKFGFISSFYFKACSISEKGSTYEISDTIVAKTINNIKKRGHKIGFHPSENTVNNHEQFKTELNRLKEIAGPNIEGGRNHGLLYTKQTLNSWEKEKLGFDSGSGFQFRNGFRSGICYDFQIFNVFERRIMNLTEIPFIAMDSVSLRNKSKPEEYYHEIVELIDIVKRYNGIACLLWHSNMFNMIERRKHKKYYFKMIEYLHDLIRK